MANTTINIQGVGGTGGSGGSGGSGGRQPDDSSNYMDLLRQEALDRLADSDRSEKNVDAILKAIENEQRSRIHERVHSRYDEDRRFTEELYSGRRDPSTGWLNPHDAQEKLADLRAIDRDEQRAEREEIDELIKALNELRESLISSPSGTESYLGQLRRQRQEAIFERDSAQDEESASAAAERVRDIERRIRDVTDGRAAEEPARGIDFGDRALQTMMGFNTFTRGMASGNLGSMIMGAGQGLTSILGMSDETASRTLSWLSAVSGISSILQEEGQRSDQMAGLAALTRVQGNRSISDTRQAMYREMLNYGVFGTGIYDMGMSVPDFAQSAERRISQRGMVQGGVMEAYFQEALERVFSLNRGSLGQAGLYDRYGMTATSAITDLVARLERISGSGITQGNYARAQEYLTMQQDLMSNYMRFSARPSFEDANRDIAAFASIEGYTPDQRTSGYIKSFQDMILNPQNDRLKAILYRVVEETVPEYQGQSTRGRTDLIDRVLRDSKYQGLIEKAYAQMINSMYGGTDSLVGYEAVKSLLPGIESPELRDKFWNAIVSGKTGDILSGNYEALPTDINKEQYVSQVSGYVSEQTHLMTQMSDSLFSAASRMEGAFGTISNVLSVFTEGKSLKQILKEIIH